VRLAALDLEVDLRRCIQGLRIRTVIPEFLGFTEFTFCLMSSFPCKLRRIHVYDAHRNLGASLIRN